MLDFMLTTPVGLFLINLAYAAWAAMTVVRYAGKEIDELRARVDTLENKETEEG